MDESKKKGISPIFIILGIIIIFVALLMANAILFMKQYKGNFTSFSKTKVEKYLDEKYGDDATDIKFLGSSSSNNGDNYNRGTYFKTHFVNYFSVHSKKYNTNFIVRCDKQTFGVYTFGRLETQKSEMTIVDNLEQKKEKNELLEILKDRFEKVETTYKVDNMKLFVYYIAKVDANLDLNNYNEIVKLKEQLKGKNGDVGEIEGVSYIYKVKFNNCELRWRQDKNNFYLADDREYYIINIDDSRFWDNVQK